MSRHNSFDDQAADHHARPLLDQEYHGDVSEHISRPSTMEHMTIRGSRTNDDQATRKKYVLASFFLGVSLVSFVIQTETAVYIQRELDWHKPYCMLWLTHSSWMLLWPLQLAFLRWRERGIPWDQFWQSHVHLLYTTAQMVQSDELHVSHWNALVSPISYMVRTTASIASALTIAGCTWYIAIVLTTPSDLTAIYNCSAFFAYVFSVPLLAEKVRVDKLLSVAVAIVGVFFVAYSSSQHQAGGTNEQAQEAQHRLLGNIVIGIGSVLYGLYEVMYKRYACPPEGTSTKRGMIFSNAFGSLIGFFTFAVLWIPLPFLHFSGLEVLEWPNYKASIYLLVSTFSNAGLCFPFPPLILCILLRIGHHSSSIFSWQYFPVHS